MVVAFLVWQAGRISLPAEWFYSDTTELAASDMEGNFASYATEFFRDVILNPRQGLPSARRTTSLDANLALALGDHFPAYEAVRDLVPIDAEVLYLVRAARPGQPPAQPWYIPLQPRRVADILLEAEGAFLRYSTGKPIDLAAFDPRAFATSDRPMYVIDTGSQVLPWATWGELLKRGDGFALWKLKSRDA